MYTARMVGWSCEMRCEGEVGCNGRLGACDFRWQLASGETLGLAAQPCQLHCSLVAECTDVATAFRSVVFYSSSAVRVQVTD